MDLAALDLPVDAIQCAHAAEALGYAGQAQERRLILHGETSKLLRPAAGRISRRALAMLILAIIEDPDMRNLRIPTTRHPGESRGPLNSLHPSSASRVALIQGVPAFAGMTGGGRVRNLHLHRVLALTDPVSPDGRYSSYRATRAFAPGSASCPDRRAPVRHRSAPFYPSAPCRRQAWKPPGRKSRRPSSGSR